MTGDEIKRLMRDRIIKLELEIRNLEHDEDHPFEKLDKLCRLNELLNFLLQIENPETLKKIYAKVDINT